MPSKHTSSDELKAKWNESDMIMRWSPEFLKIVGKHSTHWNYNKGETLLLLDEWLQDNYILKADVVEAIGQYEFGNIGYDGEEMVDDTSDDMHIRNRFRTQISESLNLEGEK